MGTGAWRCHIDCWQSRITMLWCSAAALTVDMLTASACARLHQTQAPARARMDPALTSTLQWLPPVQPYNTAVWQHAGPPPSHCSSLCSGSLQVGVCHDVAPHLRLVERLVQGCPQRRRQAAGLQRGRRRDSSSVRPRLQQLLPQPGRQLVECAQRLPKSRSPSQLP